MFQIRVVCNLAVMAFTGEGRRGGRRGGTRWSSSPYTTDWERYNCRITGRSSLSTPAETERDSRCGFDHQIAHICDGKDEVLSLFVSSCEKYKPRHCVMRRDWAPSPVSGTATPATGASFLLSPALKITDIPVCSVTASPLAGTGKSQDTGVTGE